MSTAPVNADGAMAACDHYFAAEYLRCGGPRLPTNEIARIRGRFEQVCLNEIALAGSGVTAATLEACASALDLSPCEFPAGPPQACNFKGSLPGGAACTDGLQCESGQCQDHVIETPEGPAGPPTCGTCEAAAVVGQVCAGANVSAGCSTGVCLAGDIAASVPAYTCTAIVEGDPGASCDDLSAICKPGLYCAAQTGTCTELAGMGGPCGDGTMVPGDPGGCVAPLACVGNGAPTCASGGAGASCVYDLDCTSGLGCSQSGQCVQITFVGPGQSCSDIARCLVGTCDDSGGWPRIGPIVGICPAVVPDGQPCVGGTCDTFSECFAGTCQLLDSVVCK